MNGKQIGALLSVGAAAFSGGVALGHFLAQKRVQKAIDEELNRIWHQNLGKIDKVTQTEHGIEVSGTLDTNNPVGAHIAEALKEPEFRTIRSGRIHSWGPSEDGLGEILSVNPVEEYGTGTGPIEANIFETISDWDYELELNQRADKEIYVITHDEFFGDELHYKQDQLTYYRGDDILVDSLEKPVHNYHRFVGDEMKFGHGSKDPNVVFIRNETQRIEWEICLDLGRYEEQVLGQVVEEDYEEQDLKHSAVQKFRRE